MLNPAIFVVAVIVVIGVWYGLRDKFEEYGNAVIEFVKSIFDYE